MVGSAGTDRVRRECGGRTEKAVRAKLRRMVGSASLTRGTWTLRAACAYTGYYRDQLLRAQRALDQRWKRTRAGGWYLITDEQLDDLVGWLAHDYWCRRHRLYGCAGCSGRTQPPASRGLCRRCYGRYRRVCKREGLPTGLEAQRGILGRLGERPRVLLAVREKLDRGLALGEGEIIAVACAYRRLVR